MVTGFLAIIENDSKNAPGTWLDFIKMIAALLIINLKPLTLIKVFYICSTGLHDPF